MRAAMFACFEQHAKQQQQQQRHSHQRGHRGGVDLHRVGRHAHVGSRFLRVGNAVAAHQQPVGVDAVGRAGDKGAVVLPVLDRQVAEFLRLDDADLVHLVGQGLVQHVEDEGVPFRQLVQVGEQLGAGQPAVAGQHRVGAGAAHRKAAALDVADADLQSGLVGAVVDGQIDVDLVDLDVADHVGAGHVHGGVVLGQLLVRKAEAVGFAGQGGVVGPGLREQLVVGVVVQGGHLFSVAGDGAGLVE